MPKFILIANAGYGDEAEIVECADEGVAEQHAKQKMYELAESEYDWSAEPWTRERAEELGLEEASGEEEGEEDEDEQEEAVR